MHRARKTVAATACAVVAALVLSACSGGGASSGQAGQQPVHGSGQGAQKVTLRYALWDANQVPAYQACIDEFQKQNPNIEVKIEQVGWGDYWNNLQTSMVAGNAPDVFTNHLAKYPEFVTKGQIVDIEPLVQRDKVDISIYMGDLAKLWTKDGKRYGLPKDWDTIAIAYNPDMFAKAGIDPKVTETWTWNPDDGGTFGEVIAKLTLDKNGNNALSPNFDKNNVVQYGFIPAGTLGAYGQTEWSWLAYTTGFKTVDAPWATKYNYDDPRLAKTIQWLADLANVKKQAVPFTDVASLGAVALFGNGKGAMTSVGSWQIGDVLKANPKAKFARLPIGPQGRKSMFNGLADSIWTGTKHKEEAWQLVKFLASPTCQNIVGKHDVVFPAIKSGVEERLKAAQAKGVDVSAFTKQAEEPGGTFLFPITDHASEINTIMAEVMDQIALGKAKAADVLPQANAKVNALFK